MRNELTVRELADLAGVSRQRVWQVIEEGRLPHFETALPGAPGQTRVVVPVAEGIAWAIGDRHLSRPEMVFTTRRVLAWHREMLKLEAA